MPKPTFNIHDDGSSTPRSLSKERSPHQPPPLSSHNSHSSRRYSNDTSSSERGSPAPHPHHVLVDVEEGQPLNLETDALLSGDRRSRSQQKRRHSLQTGQHSSYGATSNGQNGDAGGSGLFLTLNESAGAPLHRQESVLRLAGLIDDRAGEFERFRKSDAELKAMRKPLRKFYQKQNETLDAFREVDEVLDNARTKAATGELVSGGWKTTEKEEDLRSSIRFAINLNFAINILLLGAKIGVVLLSHSMSLVASTVDSAMDFLSTLIIFGTSHYIEKRDWKSVYAYPTGKQRMEPLGVLVFSVFMIASFLQVLIESVQKLFSSDLTHTEIPPTALIVMGGTIVIKAGVWVSCRAIKSASVEALQQDAENDIVFNFFSILFPFVGQLLKFKYLDPLGGALLSLYIIIEWTSTLMENVRKLTGQRAPPSEHQRIAYLLTRFSPLVTAVQHLSLYYAGEGMLCEVDMVLPPQTSLTQAHDVGEAAQYAIEELEGVDRAFVHIDVSVNPLSGHLER